MHTASDSQATASRSGMALKGLLAAVAIGGILIAGKYLNLQEVLRQAPAWISGIGPAGLLLFIALYIVACVLLRPGSILTLGAGMVFGVVQSSIVVSIGATLGATSAFLVGRYLARKWVARKALSACILQQRSQT